MEDYEIRDALRRAATPELHVELAFAGGSAISLNFQSHAELSDPFTIIATIINRSPQPAFHTILRIGIDTDFPLRTANEFYPIGEVDEEPTLHWLGRRFSSPPDFPIFKEMDERSFHRSSFTLAFPSSHLGGERQFGLCTSVQTPGYSLTEKWTMRSRAGMLRMYPPGHPVTR